MAIKKNSKNFNKDEFVINSSDKPIDVIIKKKNNNSKKINKIIDDNIDGVDDYNLLSEDELDYEDNKKIVLKNSIKEEKLPTELLSNKILYDKFRALIKADIIKEVSNISRQLTPNDILVAKAISEGMNDAELIELFKVDYNYLDLLKANPNFITEIQRFTQNSAFGNKNNRIQKMSRLAGMLYDDLLENPEQIQMMHPSQKLKAINDFSTNIHKMQEEENTNSNKDITVIIKERRIDESRIVKDENGKVKLKSMFPTINNNTGHVEK